MKTYLDILRNIVENGTPKQPVRFGSDGKAVPVENGTIGTFMEVFRHDMSTGFPLLTTKKMAWKSIRVELEGFIKGITDKRWFQERGCGIWNEWSNPQHPDVKASLHKKNAQELCNDLGPIYGYQWRNFDAHYGPVDFYRGEWEDCSNGVSKGSDQLATILERLRTNPYDRRMVCSAWNPNQIHMMALPPCHYAYNVVVYGKKLNLVWHQRSIDTCLGLPFNIASYALLLLLLAKEANLEPGELVGTLSDCHVYENHIAGAKLQLEREPRALPKVSIPDEGWTGVLNWTWDKVVLEGYDPHPTIKMDVTV